MFGRGNDLLTKDQRYVLRLFRKHGGMVTIQNYFTDEPNSVLEPQEGIDITVSINGVHYRALFPLHVIVQELAKKV